MLDSEGIKFPISKHAKRFVVLAIVLAVVVLIAQTVSVANRTLAWARTLPDRFEYAHEEFVVAATEAVRLALHDTDAEKQLQMIKQLSDGAIQNRDTRVWIGDEYTRDLRILSESPNSDVATERGCTPRIS